MKSILVGAVMAVVVYSIANIIGSVSDTQLLIIATVDAWKSSGWCGTG